MFFLVIFFFFFKQKTAYEMRISDWSSDVCSSDLRSMVLGLVGKDGLPLWHAVAARLPDIRVETLMQADGGRYSNAVGIVQGLVLVEAIGKAVGVDPGKPGIGEFGRALRSEEHTSELQSLMRLSYAVFCLKKKKK